MFLGRNFKYGRNGLIVIFQNMSDIIGNVLINEDDSYIIPLRKIQKGFFYLLEFGIGFDNEEIGGVCCTVSYARQEESRYGILCVKVSQ